MGYAACIPAPAQDILIKGVYEGCVADQCCCTAQHNFYFIEVRAQIVHLALTGIFHDGQTMKVQSKKCFIFIDLPILRYFWINA
jgi:hypothetical protein